MRRIFIAFLLALVGAGISRAQTVSPIRGWCESGAQQVVLAGLNSTTQVQASFPQCTVTVSIHGDGAATIFADANSTPLGNPFTAQTNGQWIFYVVPGRYDVQLSGAGFPTPITYSDIFTTGAGGATVFPGGSPIQTQVNNNGVFGGTPCESFPNILSGPELIDCDWHSRGPNPYTDLTRFGVRAVVSSATPATVGITGSINSGTTSLTVSTSSCASQLNSVCFVNGDGIVIYGAGAATTLTTPSAPTVTPSVARAGTGTEDVVNGPAGSTAYQYQIVARDRNGGLTPAGTAGTTASGQASLGSQSVAISSITRSGTTVTVTTSSAHTLTTGAHVMLFINDLSDALFSGTYQVTGSADNTHFTFLSGQSTANGAPSSSTPSLSGTVYWMNCNHVTWPAVTNAWQYYIYGRTSGSMVLLGVTHPTGPLSGSTDTAFDDFGATMMADSALGIPPYVPSSPPVGATNDYLTTKITAGAGTTSLTLANAAVTTVSGATVRLDNGPNVLTAAATAPNLYWPVPPLGTSYVVNSLTDVSTLSNAWMYAGGLVLNETMLFRGSWLGATPNNSPGTQVTFDFIANIAVATNANPGVFVTFGGSYFDRLSLSGGQNPMLVDGGGVPSGPQFGQSMTFATSGDTSDYMGIALYMRGVVPGASINGFFAQRVNAHTGPGFQGGGFTGTTFTPAVYCNGCGSVTFQALFLDHRGLMYRPDPAGPSLKVLWSYDQGGILPLVTIQGAASNAGGVFEIAHFTDDTSFQPFFAYLPSAGNVIAATLNIGLLDNVPGGGFPIISGATQTWTVNSVAPTTGQNFNGFAFANGTAQDGTINSNLTGVPNTNYAEFSSQGAVEVGTSYPVFVNGATPATPVCTITAGGTVPVASYTIRIAPVWQNGGEGVQSPSTTCATTTGNQTLNISWTAVTGGVKGYNLNINGLYTSPPSCVSPQFNSSTTSIVISAPYSTCGGASLSQIPTGGPTMLLPGTQGIAAPAVVLNGSQTVTGVQGTDTNFLSSGTVSASTGVSLCTDANHGATTSGCPSAGTFYQTVDANAVAQTQRPILNLISGANATVSCADNAGATRTDCTFAANSVTAWSSITAATNANAGTFAATGNTWDFSGATSFKVPVAGGAAPTADGTIADNSTTHGLNFGSNGNTLNVAVASTGAGGTGTTCAANSAVTALSNTVAPTCTQLTGGGLPYTNWGVNGACAQTGSGAGATQTCTISFNTTEANTSYKIVCGGTGTITGYPFMQGVITKNTTNAVVQYTNGTSNEAVVSGWANIECILTR